MTRLTPLARLAPLTRPARLLAAGAGLAVLCGCGVGVQRAPEPIPVRPPDVAVPTIPVSGPVLDTVFFVRGTRLAAVQRRTTTIGGLREVLDLLTTGPSPTEAQDGVRTALAPQPLSVLGVNERGVLTLSVSRQFTDVVGGNQLLSIAQVVWTVTQFPWVDRVRFVRDREALEVPTDHGLSLDPVGRSDYRTVAPADPPSTGAAPSSGTAPSTRSAPSSVPAAPT